MLSGFKTIGVSHREEEQTTTKYRGPSPFDFAQGQDDHHFVSGQPFRMTIKNKNRKQQEQ
jgi:hypothetical protein